MIYNTNYKKEFKDTNDFKSNWDMKDHIVYIKYSSAVIILFAMVLHVAGITPWNSILQMVGAAGWIYVGYRWNEKAIILNFLPQFAIIVPMLVYLYFL